MVDSGQRPSQQEKGKAETLQVRRSQPRGSGWKAEGSRGKIRAKIAEAGTAWMFEELKDQCGLSVVMRKDR